MVHYYFYRDGLTPTECAIHHASTVDIADYADNSINPNKWAFYNHFHKENRAINGDLGGEQMYQKFDHLPSQFPEVNIAIQKASKEDQNDFVVAIITPLMTRVLASIPQAAEVVFVDTTSHVDLQNTSVTLLLTWTPAGALPIGVLLTDCQTERAFERGL